MVRLRTKLACAALLTTGLTIAANHADAQAISPQTAPASAAAPAAPGQPLHWRMAGSSSQGVAPSPQVVASPGQAGDVPGQSAAAPMQSAPAQQSAPPRVRTRAKKNAVAEAPQPPPPPPTLEQSPPTAPQVSLQNGLLTIDAHNSTLSQVLRAVQSKTGASVEIPAGAGNDRVVAQLGPGQPRDVLNSLLNGSRFDYVILGVSGDPGAVQRVILTPRQGGSAVGNATAQNNQPQNAQPAEADAGDEGIPVADNGDQEYQSNQEPPPPPPGGFRRPMIPAPPPEQQNGFNGGDQQNGGKTPDQLLQELQQMQQQQQQYQQQLNPANQNPQQ